MVDETNTNTENSSNINITFTANKPLEIKPVGPIIGRSTLIYPNLGSTLTPKEVFITNPSTAAPNNNSNIFTPGITTPNITTPNNKYNPCTCDDYCECEDRCPKCGKKKKQYNPYKPYPHIGDPIPRPRIPYYGEPHHSHTYRYY